MRTKFQRSLNRFLILITQGSLIFLTLILLISELNETEPSIQGDISKVNGTADTLQTFSNAVVLGPGKIRVAGVSSTMRYLAPRPTIDPIYALFFFFKCINNCFLLLGFFIQKSIYKKGSLGIANRLWTFACIYGRKLF